MKKSLEFVKVVSSVLFACSILFTSCSYSSGSDSGGEGNDVPEQVTEKKAGDVALTTIKIGDVTYEKTTEVYVTTKDGATITGANPSFVEASADAKFKGVFTTGRKVKLNPFIMSKYMVTQELYTAVMTGQTVNSETLEATPFKCEATGTYALVSGEVQKYRAADNISWYDAVYFCNVLTEKTMTAGDKVYTITNITVEDGSIQSADVTADFTKKGYRLPSEAEWEFAARGGDHSKNAWNYLFSGAASAGNVSYNAEVNAGVDTVGWYSKNLSNGTTDPSMDLSGVTKPAGYGSHEVGKKAANALGIFDMSGNVYEWCYDLYNDNVTAGDVTENGVVSNPVGASSGTLRVRRGGAYSFNAKFCTVTYRNNKKPDYRANMGFRVVRNAQ